MNYEDIMELSNVTEGINIIQSSLPQSCQICLENKSTKSPKSQEEITVHVTKPLYRIHSNICGPIDPTSREGYKYVINFVDEYSSMIFVYPLRHKDETHIALKKFLTEVAPIGLVKEIHTDNGGEYVSQAFQQVLLDNQIKHTTTAPYSPFQNGKSERSWWSLMEMARCPRQRRIQDAAHAACAAVKIITYHDVIIAFRVVKTNTIDFKECSSTSDFWCGTSDNRAAFW